MSSSHSDNCSRFWPFFFCNLHLHFANTCKNIKMYIHFCIWFLHFLTFEICFWYTDKRASQNTKRWLGNLTFEKTWLWILIVTTFDWSFCQCNKIVVPKWLWLEMSILSTSSVCAKVCANRVLCKIGIEDVVIFGHWLFG